MKKGNIIFLFSILSILIIVMWEIGLHFSLYWIFWWYDLMMHFLGGFWIGLITYTFFIYGKEENVSSLKNPTLTIALVAMLIGIIWEWFEIEKGLASSLDNGYFFDTITDLTADLVGAFASYHLTSRWFKEN